MNSPRRVLPSKRLYLFFIPVILGLIIFAVYQNSQINVANSNNQNQLTSIVDSNNSTSPGNIPYGEISSNNGTASVATTTFTEQIAQKLYLGSLSLQQNGADNLGNFQNLILSTANDVLASSTNNTYTSNDLNIIPAPSGITAFLSFANAFLLKSNQVNRDVQTIGIIGNLADPTAPYFGETMVAVSKTYKNFTSDLLLIAVPQEIVEPYLLLINNYASLAEDYAGVGAENVDPLLSVVAINRIKSDEAKQQTIAQTLGNYLQTHGVVYSSKLGKYILK